MPSIPPVHSPPHSAGLAPATPPGKTRGAAADGRPLRAPRSERLRNGLCRALPLLLLALAVGLVWGRSLGFQFVWDDFSFIVHNEALRSPSHVPELFTREDAQRYDPTDNAWGIYRPLRTLHYAVLVWGFGKPVPWVFHLANLVWHTLASWLLYLLLVRLLAAAMPCGAARRWALLAALGFAIHPVAAEVVCWAKSLDDLMATAFVLGAALAAWHAWRPAEGETAAPRRRWAWAAGSLLLFAAALWSKESVVALFPLFLFPWLAWGVRRRSFFLWVGAQAILALVYLLARQAVLGEMAQVRQPISGTYAGTLVDMLPVVLLYGRTMLGIPPFLPDYHFMAGGTRLLDAANLAGLALLAAGLLLFALALGRARRHPALWFGLGWVGLALLPVSNLVPMMQYFAERFVYLPLVGALIAVAGLPGLLLRETPEPTLRRRWLAGAGVAAAVLLLWAGIAFREAAKWRDEETLMTYAYRHSPPSRRIVVNYLVVLNRRRADDEIEAVLARHRKLLRGDAKAQWIEGMVLLRRSGFESARRRLRAVESKLGRHPEFLLSMGIMCAKARELQEARRYFERLTEQWPRMPDGWTNLGVCLADLGDYAGAVRALERAVALTPEDANAWQALANAAWKRQDWPLARRALTELTRLEPEEPEHRHFLALLARR